MINKHCVMLALKELIFEYPTIYQLLATEWYLLCTNVSDFLDNIRRLSKNWNNGCEILIRNIWISRICDERVILETEFIVRQSSKVWRPESYLKADNIHQYKKKAFQIIYHFSFSDQPNTDRNQSCSIVLTKSYLISKYNLCEIGDRKAYSACIDLWGTFY